MITEKTIKAVMKIAHEIKLRDGRFGVMDSQVARVWAEEFDENQISEEAGLSAVKSYYRLGSDRVMQIGDVVRLGRDYRSPIPALESVKARESIENQRLALYETMCDYLAQGDTRADEAREKYREFMRTHGLNKRK